MKMFILVNYHYNSLFLVKLSQTCFFKNLSKSKYRCSFSLLILQEPGGGWLDSNPPPHNMQSSALPLCLQSLPMIH